MRRSFLAVLFVAAMLTKTDPESAHEFSRLGTVESLVERGTYQLDDSIFITTVDKIYRDGHFYSHQPPMLATLEVPVYWVIRQPGIRFNNRGRRVATYLFSLATNGIALALTAVLFGKVLGLCGIAPRLRDFYAVLLPLGTWLLPYGVVSNNHGIAGMLLAALIWILLSIEWHGATVPRMLCCGVVLGLLATIELLPLVSFVPLALIYLAFRHDAGTRGLLWLGAGLAGPLLAHVLINVRITGDALPAGFHHELFQYPESAFNDDSLTGTVKYDSLGSLAGYSWKSMFAGKGFLTFAPLLLMAAIAAVVHWRWWSRARGVYLVLVGGILLSLGAALLTTNNYGGGAVGFRHAAYLSPAFLTFLVPWIATDRRDLRAGAWAVIAVAALSAALMLVFAVRQPWSALSFDTAPIGTWDQYAPIVARIVAGDLLRP